MCLFQLIKHKITFILENVLIFIFYTYKHLYTCKFINCLNTPNMPINVKNLTIAITSTATGFDFFRFFIILFCVFGKRFEPAEGNSSHKFEHFTPIIESPMD